MQKVVDFLEKHVQWVALGLGGLYLLYMVWSYILTPPVTTEISGAPDPLTPGTVDQYILDNRIRELNGRVNDTRTVDVAVPDFSEKFKEILNGGQAPMFDGAYYVDSKSSKIQYKEEGPANDDGTPIGERVAALPAAPAPKLTDQGTGRSLVIEPVIRGAPAANKKPERARDNARAVADKPAGIDKDWVSIFYKISTVALEEAFKKSKLPEEFQMTSILTVELIRERQLPDGSWGEETVVKPAEFLQIQDFPANKAQQAFFADWAAKNITTIVQPNFYQISKGDLWPPIELVGDEIDPATKAKREADQRRRLEERKRKQEQQRRMQQQRRPTNQRNRPGGGIPGMMPGGMFAPRDNDRARNSRPAAAPPMMPGMMDPGMMMPGMIPGMMPGDLPGMDRMPGAQPGRQTSPNFKAPPLPPGVFNPAQENDIEGWIHDDTVEPGNVYRYKVKYRIKNPVYEQTRLVAKPELAEQFAIESNASDWSDEVEVPPLSYFFIAGGISPNNNTVRFDVFKWTDGEWKMHSIDASPGDVITGEREDEETGEQLNFTTDITVVALHRDDRGGPAQILLMDKAGVVETRDYATDQANPTYRELKQEVAAAAAAADTRPRAAAR